MPGMTESLPHYSWRSFLALCKPRVVALIVFTAVVGMLLAVPGLPDWQPLLFGTLGIGLAASSAAAINHVLDQKIDAQMSRTDNRPLPKQQIRSRHALMFAAVLGALSMLILILKVNALTAWLTFASLIGYAVIYTVFLKRITPQNIVIGGAAGAAPPVLGWTAVTDDIHGHALLLFLIIFVWTPPHFWALAIARRDEYANVKIPMLPVTHGIDFTKLQILLYTILLCVISLLPYLTHMSGLIYLGTAIVGDIEFMRLALKLKREADHKSAMRTFAYSIIYLTAIFAALMLDHYLPIHLT
jgi:heme o synthase